MLIPDELVWEVLRRLPVKSLMRFKCVSKIWLSITEDLSFAKAYCGGSRGLLSGQPARFQPCNKRCLFYIGLDGGRATTHQILPYYILEHESRDQMIRYTDVVHGLLCFYQGKHSWLCNVATREMMQLPSLTDSYEESNIRYHFGFDPISKHYKLLKTSHRCVEILTIGVDSYWRSVISLPPHVDIASQSTCVGGFLCWIEEYEPVLVGLLAFHLASEEFVHIPSPIEPAEVDFYFNEGMDMPFLKLLRFGSSIIVTKEFDREEETVKMLRYRGPGNGHGSNKFWVDVLPQLRQMDTNGSSLKTLQDLTAIGMLPDGKMLIYDHTATFPTNLYALGPGKREQELIKVNASKELLNEYGCVFPSEIFDNCSYLEENIMPLTHLISSD